jgi:Caspase domain
MAVVWPIKTIKMEEGKDTRKIYALLVGINRYPAGGKVRNLYGCVGDIERMDTFLYEQLGYDGRYESKLLRNQEATRTEIIKQFRNHLGKAATGDTVLFMYAGHGSRQPSAVEFRDRYPDQMDETLVCYDSRLPDGLDLADKELAILISELKARHILVILDSCHSGSGTREDETGDEVHFRSANPIKQPRELPSYLEGHFSRQIEQRQSLSIPLTPHILLAACTRHEQAGEHYSGFGYFSNSLLTVLKSAGCNISYSDLFLRSRIAIKKGIGSQTPQFECYGGENPDGSFLSAFKNSFPNYNSAHIYPDAERWYLNIGALHDLPSESRQTNFVSVSNADGETIQLQIKGVGIERSEIQIPPKANLKPAAIMQAKVHMFRTPASLVLLNVGQSMKRLIFQHRPEALNIDFTEDQNLADFELRETNGRLELIEMQSRRLLRYTLGSNLAGILAIFDTVKKVLTWQRFQKLSNFSMEAQFSSVQVRFSLIDSSGHDLGWPAKNTSLAYPHNGNGQMAYFPSCYIKNGTARTLFFNLFYLSREYGIKFLECKEIAPSDSWVTLWEKHDGSGLHLPNGLNEATEIFKVLISKEEIQSWLIAQTGFEVGTEILGAARDLGHAPTTSISEWVARTFVMKLAREQYA